MSRVPLYRPASHILYIVDTHSIQQLLLLYIYTKIDTQIKATGEVTNVCIIYFYHRDVNA